MTSGFYFAFEIVKIFSMGQRCLTERSTHLHGPFVLCFCTILPITLAATSSSHWLVARVILATSLLIERLFKIEFTSVPSPRNYGKQRFDDCQSCTTQHHPRFSNNMIISLLQTIALAQNMLPSRVCGCTDICARTDLVCFFLGH